MDVKIGRESNLGRQTRTSVVESHNTLSYSRLFSVPHPRQNTSLFPNSLNSTFMADGTIVLSTVNSFQAKLHYEGGEACDAS